jgi:hypothetical protein
MTVAAGPLDAATKRAKVMADPLRVEILQHILEFGCKAPSEVANELNEPVNKVSYHCRKLVEYGYFEVAREEPGLRGSTKTFFCAIEQDFIGESDWEEMDDSRKPGALNSIFALVIGDFDHALEADTFGDDGRWHLMRNPMRSVDQQGLDDLLKAHMDLYNRTVEIQREAAERLAASGEEPVAVASSSECFRVAAFRGRKSGKVDRYRPVHV